MILNKNEVFKTFQKSRKILSLYRLNLNKKYYLIKKYTFVKSEICQ